MRFFADFRQPAKTCLFRTAVSASENNIIFRYRNGHHIIIIIIIIIIVIET